MTSTSLGGVMELEVNAEARGQKRSSCRRRDWARWTRCRPSSRFLIRHQNHDDVGALGGFAHIENFQSLRLHLGARGTVGRESDDHFQSAVAQVQRVRVALAAVADDGDGLSRQINFQESPSFS